MQDTMLYDGDQQRYLQLLANGGEEEVGIDASDVDSSDVASSNDIDSSDDSDDGGSTRDKLSSSVARSAARGKRGRAAMGVSAPEDAEALSDPNPLMAEIGSKTERRQAAAQRWFSDPMFADVDETLAAEEEEVIGEGEDGEKGDDEATKPPTKRSRRGCGVDGKGKRRGGGSGQKNNEEPKKALGAAEALMAEMPKTEKEKRKEKRKKVTNYGSWKCPPFRRHGLLLFSGVTLQCGTFPISASQHSPCPPSRCLQNLGGRTERAQGDQEQQAHGGGRHRRRRPPSRFRRARPREPSPEGARQA